MRCLSVATVVIAALALPACGDKFSSGDGGSGGTGAVNSNTNGSGGHGGAGQGGNGNAGAGGNAVPACRALDFDGIGQFVRVPDAAALDNITDITVEAWIKLEYSWEEVQVLSHHDHGAHTGYVLLIYGDNGNNIQELSFRYQRAGVNEAVGYDEVTLDVWHHVAATFDNDYLRLFIDGVMVGDSQIGPGKADDYAGPLVIGATANESGFFFPGAIDEVRLSRVARYTADFPLPPRRLTAEDDNTVALWHFDEKDDNPIVIDATDTHHGTLGASNVDDIDDPVRIDVDCE